jgi:hypothetical protein
MTRTPAPLRLRLSARRPDRQNQRKQQRTRERSQRLFAKLKDGAVLCRHHQRNRVVWCLVWRDGSEWLTHEAVTEILASGHVVGVGDALPFAGAELSQTYRWVE